AAVPPPAARAAPGSLAGRFGNSQRATSGPVDPALLPGGSGYDASGQAAGPAPQYPPGATPPPPMSGSAMRGVVARAAGGPAGRFGDSQYATSGAVDPALLSGAPPSGDPGAIPPPPQLSQSAPFPLPSVGGTVAPPALARAEIPPPPTLMPDQRPSAAGSRSP